MKKTLLLAFFLVICIGLATGKAHKKRYKSSNYLSNSSKSISSDAHDDFTPGDGTKWVARGESMPDGIKAFQEYKGQYLNLLNNNWKIYYGANYEGAKILFTDHGVIYTLTQAVKDTTPESDDNDGDNIEEKNKEKQQRKILLYKNYTIEWENANPNLTVEGVDELSCRFGALNPKNVKEGLDNIKGYSKIIYHNVYPNIDLVYTFHQDKGLEYSFILHPGANPDNIKIFYGGPGINLNNGDVHITTPLGDMIDHAPITNQNGNNITSSFNKIGDHEVNFKLGAYDGTQDLIIDPWTVSPIGTAFLPMDVHFDGANNVYIYGADNYGADNYVQKYTAAGALSWTYDLTQYGNFSGYVSDLAVDKAGNSYVAGPYPYTNGSGGDYTMVCLTTAGALSYDYNTCAYNSGSAPPNEIFEVWNLSYSCDFSELVQAGSPTVVEEDVGIVNAANGHVSGQTVNTSYGEIYAGCIAPNGNYYAIAANPCFGCSTPGDDIVCYTLAAGTATFSWNKQSAYQWNDFDSKNPNGIATNGIAAGCAYLYTSDGKSLDQRSLANGTSSKTVTIPGGTNTDPSPSGIAVDMGCGYVYVGTPTTVQVYDMNLNTVTTQATPSEVYGVAFNNGLVAACGGTTSSNGWVMVFNAQVCTTALTITHTNTTCGNNNGTATVATPTFCTGPYTYLWNPGGQTTQTATGLAAGVYTVDVGTSTSCITVSDTVTIKPSTNVTLSATATNGCTGSVTTTVTGGVSPYTYAWSNGATTTSITGVPAGTYTVTVTDAYGCVKTTTATITTVGVTITPSQVNESCNGGANGSATLTVSGGTPPYTYAWGSGATTSSITGLTVGTYTCTVTESGGCTGTASITITQPTAVTGTTTPVSALCNGGNGSISATGAGGTAGYTYAWSNGSSGSNITAPAGPYTVTITDANGCTGTATGTITAPAPVTGTTSATPASCTASNGTASVSGAAGGTGPYTYSWSNGQTGTTATALASGTYTVTIKDANGCTGQVTVVVPGGGSMRDSVVAQTNEPCFGNSVGTVTLGVKGTAPFTYAWSNGATTSNLTGLAVGTYTVAITDGTGCTGTASVTITQPTQLRDSIIATVNELCFGASTGSISVGDTGGTFAYTYSWAPAGGTGPTANNLPAGSYTVTVTDANGCTTTASATITQPTELTVSAAAFPVSCSGECNGQLVCIPTGGTTAYSYNWSNGATTASVLNVCAGTYSVVVKDANGCTVDSIGLIVTSPPALTATTSNNTAFCGQADGGACVTAGGGTPGYTYSWNDGFTTSCINNVLPVTYTCVVTDSKGCTDTATVTVPNTPGDTANITAVTNVTCNGGNDGTVTGDGTGGVAPYTYSWSTVPVQTTPAATGLTAGTYTLTVTDSKGCIATATVTVTQPTLVVPSAGPPSTICIGQSSTVSVSATGGTPGYTYTWAPGGMTGSPVTVTPTVTTTYTASTTDANGCTGPAVTVVVTVNPPLNVTITPNQSICPGATAPIGATASGGDGTYNYSWTPAASVACSTCQNTTASPGTTTEYTVTVSDNCGTPPVTDTVKVTVDPLPVVNFKADTIDGCTPLCINFTDLTTVAGGNVVSWAWTFGTGATSTSQNPSYCYTNSGTYTVGLTVVSNSGCVDSLTVNNMITAYSHPVAAFTASPQPVTIVDPTVNFTDQSTDQYGIVSWAWVFGDPADGSSTKQNPSYTYADTGTYCPILTVTNKYGCTDSVQHCIIVEPFFTLYIPNAFSPNGDGLNDVFTAKGTYVCTFQMYIFDRWGMQLFYTEDINQGWNGTVNGGSNLAQEDTYVYLIIATDCIEHKKHQYLGRVSIIK